MLDKPLRVEADNNQNVYLRDADGCNVAVFNTHTQLPLDRDDLLQEEFEEAMQIAQELADGVNERIVAAAIKYGDLIGSVPAPGRHHDVIRAWADRARLVTRGKDEQGFTTSTGRFVGRQEAMQIAIAAGQVDPANRKIDTGSSDLFSEDLW